MKSARLTGWPIKLLITRALLLVLFSFLAVGLPRAHLVDLQRSHVAMAALMVLMAVLISAWKWGLLLTSRGHPLPMRRLLRHYFVGLFFDNLLREQSAGRVINPRRPPPGRLRAVSTGEPGPFHASAGWLLRNVRPRN
jgi:hypothetical protein